MQAQQRLKCLVVTLVVLTLSTVAQAQIHLEVPEDRQPPIYANFNREFMPHTEEWAVVIFYRNTDCVPADFNLLDFIDPRRARSSAPCRSKAMRTGAASTTLFRPTVICRERVLFPCGLCAGPSCKRLWRTTS